MRILITGATGLIGHELVKQCSNRQVAVNYLTTDPKKIENKPGYQGFLWDVKERQIDTACIQGVEAIIHLAGASVAKRWTDDHKKAIIESRIDTADLLFETLKNNKNQVKHFISASAIGGYPPSLTKLYYEDYPEFDKGFLGQVVKAWEAAAERFRNLDLQVSKIRIGVVMATNGGALPQITKPIKNYVGAPLGSGKQWQSWIHIRDLAAIFLYCLQNELTGVYNAVAPDPVTNKILTKTTADVLDKPLWLPNVPPFAMKLLLGQMATMVLEGQRVSADKIIGEGFDFKFSKLKPALKDLLER